MILATSLLVGEHVHATHIIGGEINYQYIGTIGNQWEFQVTVEVYKDCHPSVTGTFDIPLILTIFDANNNVFRLDSIPFPANGATRLPVVVNNPCLIAPPNICVDQAVYSKVIRLPISTGGYTLTYERCCRNAGILNILTPGSVGSTYTITIPGTNTLNTTKNSSPVFTNYPPLVLCLGDSLNFDHSATDADGDSLVYEICTPYQGGGRGGQGGGPRPIPANAPPYSFVPWSNGYSNALQIDGNPAFTIHPATGKFRGTPSKSGKFVVGICVSEYRNGVLLSVNKRDFQFTVTLCDPNSTAAASSQELFCDGLTVKFTNNSQNANIFFWDFGVPNIQTDTSNQREPTYTFPDTGKYTITLIANPGWTCADTVQTVYEVYPQLEPYYAPPDPRCFDDHMLSFSAGGRYQQYATFEWDFGPVSKVSGAFVKDPTGISYRQPGVFPVTLTIKENGCVESYTDSVYIYPNPVAKFDVDERSGCIPHRIQLINQSTAWEELQYRWVVGDAWVSNEENPVFEFDREGLYTVYLEASTHQLCVDTSSLYKLKYIRVYPNPEADLAADRTETSIFDPYITFSDLSEGGRICELDLGDGLSYGSCDYKHRYWESGEFTVTQIVKSQYGCTDTNLLDIYIRPEFTFYVPNAFTPNGDGVNDIFLPKGDAIASYDFRIYNRGGQLLFKTEYLRNGWDGKVNGVLSPIENYVYVIRITDELGEDHEFRGTVALLR